MCWETSCVSIFVCRETRFFSPVFQAKDIGNGRDTQARNGPRLFPSRGAPLSPEDQARARANRLLTVISRRPQPERERIWRRFRVFETYMA